MNVDYQKKISEMCSHFNINKTELSEKLNIGRTTMFNLESGKLKKPSTELLKKLESVGISKEWFKGESETMLLKSETTPMMWEDLKKQYEKRIADLEFIANLFKAEKMADPRYVNFLQPNTEKGRVIPMFADNATAGATCGVVANF
jgi:predicted transcriptional regulator